MRKYFLLSFAALIAASTANATDGTSQLKATATIIEPTIVDCTPIDFGTLYFHRRPIPAADAPTKLKMDSSGKLSNVNSNPEFYPFSLLTDAQGTPGTCTGLPEGAGFTLSSTHNLYLDTAQKIYVSDIEYADGKLTGTIMVESDAVLDGSELTSSAVILFTYE